MSGHLILNRDLVCCVLVECFLIKRERVPLIRLLPTLSSCVFSPQSAFANGKMSWIAIAGMRGLFLNLLLGNEVSLQSLWHGFKGGAILPRLSWSGMISVFSE